MTARYFTIILVLLLPFGAESQSKDPKYKPGLVDVGLDERKLGENLWIFTQNYGQQSGWSKQSCSIVYKELTDVGEDLIPVLILPDLENDYYDPILEDGIIRVSKRKSKTEVVTVDSALLRSSSEGIKGNLKRIVFKTLPPKDEKRNSRTTGPCPTGYPARRQAFRERSTINPQFEGWPPVAGGRTDT